jgi:hypothetical protein
LCLQKYVYVLLMKESSLSIFKKYIIRRGLILNTCNCIFVNKILKIEWKLVLAEALNGNHADKLHLWEKMRYMYTIVQSRYTYACVKRYRKRFSQGIYTCVPVLLTVSFEGKGCVQKPRVKIDSNSIYLFIFFFNNF